MTEQPKLNDKLNDPTETESFSDPNEPTARTAFPTIMIVAGVVLACAVALLVLYFA